MKRGIPIIFLLIILSSFAFVSAQDCDLDITLINQDPYPAIPGDYVKIVFQIDGVSNPECGTVQFELLEQYPLIFDPGQESKVTFQSGIYNKDFNSFKNVPYKIRIDGDALNGDTPIEIQYKTGFSQAYISEQFNLNIEDTRADFEVYIKDYNPTTKELTFEILNTADVDIEALTVEIPEQENVVVKGSKTNIIGDLDSNEYTTADFEANPLEGEIKVSLTYTDTINKRRTIEKKVLFEPEYFEGRANGDKKTSIWLYFFWILVIILIGRYFYKKNKAKKKLEKERARNRK